MRDGPRKVAGSLLAAVLLWTGGKQAQAQNAPQNYLVQTGYNDAAPGERNDLLEQMQRRLDAQEAEIRALRNQQQGIAATPVAMDLAGEKAAAAPAGPKEVPIYTGPSFKPTDIKVGAKMFLDQVDYSQSASALAATRSSVGATTPAELNTTDMGFLRLYVQGLLYENVDFKFEIDFANNVLAPTTSPSTVQNPSNPAGFTGRSIFDTIALKDIYATIRLLPYVGNVRIGHFKEPFHLDELTSDEDLLFERRNQDDCFAPARKFGLMAFNYVNENKDLSYYLGTFNDATVDTTAFVRTNEGCWDIVGRLVWLPYYDEPSDGRYLIHTGMDARWSGAPNSITNPTASPDFKAFNDNPEAQTLNPFIQTGNIVCDSYAEFNPEFAAIWGPWTVKSEATWVSFYGNGLGGSGTTRTISGAYAEVAYMLTGENHGYDRELKRLSTVKPYEPFFRVNTCDGVCMGKGAWEVAARYSIVDLNDTTIRQGQCHDYTLGLNWYLNQYCRVWFDYIHADVTGAGNNAPSGAADIYETRFSFAY